MRPAVAKLTVWEARALFDGGGVERWAEANGIPFAEALDEVGERAVEDVPAMDDPRRKDAAALREFVRRVERFSPQMDAVARLCLEHGLSLTACAARLGISRETVRVHLRRLRKLRRELIARRYAEAPREVW